MNTEDCTLWMGDIEPWMDESFIMNAFNECGFKPNNIIIIKNKMSNRYRNFGFITFDTFQEANNAIFKLNAKLIPQTNIYFKLNLTKNNKKTTKNAYVGNLPPTMNDIDLYNMFKSKYPSVYYASIITDNGISRGYGFVHFQKEEEYKKCLEEMDVIIMENRIVRVKEKKNNNNDYIFGNNNNDFIIRNNYNDYIKNNNNDYIIKNNNYINESSSADNETNFSSIEKEQDLSYSNSSQNKTFLNNIELLESNDINELYKKMQETADKIVGHYKNINKFNEISKMILYYSSESNNSRE